MCCCRCGRVSVGRVVCAVQDGRTSDELIHAKDSHEFTTVQASEVGNFLNVVVENKQKINDFWK